mgnify:CR=1 FL=1
MANKINSMTESGILAAITVVMALIAVYVPMLGIVAVLLWPLPMIVLIVRHGLRWGIMSVLVAAILTAVLVEPLISLRLALAFAPGGIALGIGYRRGWPGVRIFTVGVIVSLAAKMAALGLVFLITNIHPFTMQFDALNDSFQKSVEIYQSFNMTEEQIEQAKETFSQNMQLVKLLLPMVVVLMGLMDTALNFVIGGKVLHRLGHDVPVFPKFTEWRLPKAFLYLFGFSLVGMYWGTTRELALLYQVSLNGNMIATFAGIIQGVALYQNMTERYHWSKILSTVVLVFIVLNGVLLQLLAFTGLFDMVFDYRRRFGRRG